MENQNYRKARVEAGLSGERAAVELGVSISTLYAWERNDTSPDADKLVLMSKLYDKPVDYLLALA